MNFIFHMKWTLYFTWNELYVSHEMNFIYHMKWTLYITWNELYISHEMNFTIRKKLIKQLKNLLRGFECCKSKSWVNIPEVNEFKCIVICTGNGKNLYHFDNRIE